jgi:hypothetical protein
VSDASEKAYSVESRLNQILAIATDWANFGSMSNGWSVGAYAKYRLDYSGNLCLTMRLNTGTTTTDGTTIWSAANGLPSGFRPVSARLIAASTDHQSNPGSLGSESAGIMLQTDGSILCYGLAGAANVTRLDVHGVYPIDI